MSKTTAHAMFTPLTRWSGWLGIALVSALATAATWMARLPSVEKLGLSPLTWAIVFGIALGNTVFPMWGHLCGDGVDFSKAVLLRAGIILYGFRITLQQVFEVGWHGLIADACVVCSIFALALLLGRWLRLDRDTAILIGAGSGICGAAAVMATEPILKTSAARVSVAIATVVLFGTISMFLYPVLQSPLGLSDGAYGLMVGSTVHEVAQVVAAGRAVSEEAASVAVIVKMLRVMMLAPFLMVVSLRWGGPAEPSENLPTGEVKTPALGLVLHRLKNIDVPWFAVAFVGVTCLYSTQLVPPTAVAWLVTVDTIFLAMAMAALGLRTRISALRAAGPRPMVLAAGLFVALLTEGFVLTKVIGT